MSLLLLVAACTLLSSAAGPTLASPGHSRAFRGLIYFLFGLLQLHLALGVLDLLGLRWSRGSIAAVLVLLYLLARLLHRDRRPSAPRPLSLGWGDALAIVPWAGLPTPDLRPRARASPPRVGRATRPPTP